MKKDITEHGGPVVIVVSDDSENNNLKLSSPINNLKYNSFDGISNITITDTSKQFDTEHENVGTDKTLCNNTHNLLCKYNSYPQPDRSNTKNHLRVPSASNLSTSDTDSSIYSSNEDLGHQDELGLRDDGSASSSDCHLDQISCCSNPNSDIGNTAAGIRHHSFSDGKITIQDNRLNPLHKPLTRAVSAPLKSNEHTMLSIENGFIHKRSNTQRHQENNSSKLSLFIAPKVLKNAVKRVRSAEPPRSSSTSTFSLRRTVSNSIRGWSNQQSSSFITFPSKNKKKPRQRYKIVEAKTGQRDGLSFELVGKQGTFLRVKGSILISDKDTSDTHFNKDCTFVPLPDMWFPSFFAFESVSKPSYFLRLTSHEELVLEKYDCTKDFKEEASFQLNRKPCATCLQVGIQTWAKKSSGEFCLGKVMSIRNEMVEVKFNDERTLSYPMSNTGDLVPDIIPSADDISIGTKVIAQWLSRSKLYAGVVSGIRGGDTYEVLFDDGDVCREKAFQIRLVRAYFFHPGSDVNGHSDDVKTCNSNSDECRANSENLNDKNSDIQLEKASVTHTNSNDSDICVDKTSDDDDENTLPRLSFSSSSPDSQGISEILSAGHSSTIIDNNFPNSHGDGKQYKTYTPWEIETFSQDSGYHGYDKQNNKEKMADVNFCLSEHHHYHDDIDKDLQEMCRKMVRSKSLDDVESELNYRLQQMRRTKSLSFKNISFSLNSCTGVMVK